MTQRIKKILFKRPTISMGNNVEAVLPGGPLLADYYYQREFRLNFFTPEISYVLWEWNGVDTSQFGNIVLITGSDSVVSVSGQQNFEVTSSLALRNNPWGGGSVESAPYLNPPESGSFLKFYHSGSYNGFFVPINDLNPLDYLNSGIQIEYFQMSASTGGSSISQNIGFGYVQYEPDGKVTGMGVVRNLTNRVAFGYLNKSRAFYSTYSQGGQETSRKGPHLNSIFLGDIPSGSSITKGRFESTTAAFGSNGTEFNTHLINQIGIGTFTTITSFFTSSFVPTKFGFWVYNDGLTNREHSIFLSKIRIVVPWRAR